MIYLKPTNSPLAYQTSFNSEQLNHKSNVIRLWEQPTEIFQKYAGLLPFATLSQTNNPEEALRQVAKQIEIIPDRRVQSNVAAATYIISGLALSKEIIQRLLRSELMKESVTYQEILREGLEEGKARGLEEGLAEGLAIGEAKATNQIKQIAMNMIDSGLTIDLIAQLTGLTPEQIQKLQ